MEPKLNRLGKEKSPYLLQHSLNPVDWFPWGEEAFAKARSLDRPIFLSIGYSTCYWCHMMEKDSFEKTDVAGALSSDFVSIKLDREERPDLDQVYMDFVVAVTGHGGWPLSVFLTPELKPFWGGTFFYREHFLKVLSTLSAAWKTSRAEIESSATHILQALTQQSQIEPGDLPDIGIWPSAVESLNSMFDDKNGGFGSAPKFPPSSQLWFLLSANRRLKTNETRDMLQLSLYSMAAGGIFDHLGGGFSRYSTDQSWTVPHFEKMLYDNAQLIQLYSNAFKAFRIDFYAEVVQMCVDYCSRVLLSAEGGFYTAQDAGEAGEEGKYYIWDNAQLAQLLTPEEITKLAEVFDLSGNFEHEKVVLRLKPGATWEMRSSRTIKTILDKLSKSRELRNSPHVDTKIVAGWNGLMLSALCCAYQAFGKRRYLDLALNLSVFIRGSLYKDPVLFRRYADQEARHGACLDDYAYVIEGFINLYQSTFDESALSFAAQLQETQDRQLWRDGSAYVYSSAADVLVVDFDLSDSAQPSANAVSVQNLFKLAILLKNDTYRLRAETILRGYKSYLSQSSYPYVSALMSLEFSSQNIKEVVLDIKDETGEKMWKLVMGNYIGGLVYARTGKLIPQLGSGTTADKSSALLCQNGSCLPAVTEIDQFCKLLEIPS